LLNWKAELIKNWIQEALDFLGHSLTPIPQELNELFWKEDLSPESQPESLEKRVLTC